MAALHTGWYMDPSLVRLRLAAGTVVLEVQGIMKPHAEGLVGLPLPKQGAHPLVDSQSKLMRIRVDNELTNKAFARSA